MVVNAPVELEVTVPMEMPLKVNSMFSPASKYWPTSVTSVCVGASSGVTVNCGFMMNSWEASGGSTMSIYDLVAAIRLYVPQTSGLTMPLSCIAIMRPAGMIVGLYISLAQDLVLRVC